MTPAYIEAQLATIAAEEANQHERIKLALATLRDARRQLDILRGGRQAYEDVLAEMQKGGKDGMVDTANVG